MALEALPPWLQVTPETYQGAMRSGSALGAQLRGQDIAQGEARDRLGLAYAQLQSQEERASEQAQAKLQLAHAQLTARQQQSELMASFRERALEQAQQRQDELAQYRAAGLAEKQKSGAEMMDLRERRLQDLNTYREGIEGARAKSEALQEKNTALREAALKAPRLTEADKALMGADVADLKGLEKKIETTQPRSLVGKILHLGGNAQEIADMKSEALKLRSKIASYEPKARQLDLSSSAAPAAAATATPFKEGALIRSKKDGKLYRVKNGEPVLEEGKNADQSQ